MGAAAAILVPSTATNPTLTRPDRVQSSGTPANRSAIAFPWRARSEAMVAWSVAHGSANARHLDYCFPRKASSFIKDATRSLRTRRSSDGAR